jgi:hypothetical protein
MKGDFKGLVITMISEIRHRGRKMVSDVVGIVDVEASGHISRKEEREWESVMSYL